MNRMGVVLIAAAGLTFGGPAHAHHSFATVYDGAQTITIEGRLVSFAFRSPHSVVTVETAEKGEDGANLRWTVEWGSVAALANQGVTRAFFKPGDQVVITGHPGRNPAAHVMVMQTLTRPSDGFEWGKREGEKVQ